MNELRKNSIKVDGTVVSVYPQFNYEEQIIDMTDVRSDLNGCYSTNNGVVCFVADGEVCVTPITDAVIEALNSAGLREARFYVPFSNWDYPKFQKGAWESLWNLARAERSREDERDAE